MGQSSAKPPGGVRADADSGERSSRRTVWAGVVCLLIVGGVVGSVFAGMSVSSSHASDSRHALERSAGEVVSTLQLAIEHQADLVVNASGFVAGSPEASQDEFQAWADSVHVLERYPELAGFGLSVIVSSSELPAFVEQHLASVTNLGAPFQLVPPGDRPFYCLQRLGIARVGASPPPFGTDLCAVEGLGPALLGARDSGESIYSLLTLGDENLLSVATPVYSGGVLPTTVAGRRERFLGWLGSATVQKVLLDRALEGHPDMSVVMRYEASVSRPEFSSGSDATRQGLVSTQLGDGWTVEVSGDVASGRLLDDGDAVALLLSGVALSLLVGVLVLVLASGRTRAVRLVAQRTGELRHQALHDALTGLPNRALIMDRVEQLLARGRRNGTTSAALFIDLDDFKNVNDTLGHHAGDQLLVAVAARLTTALRDVDTIGRMGGDEFIVLIDGASVEAGPELVATRLLDVMRHPFELEAATMPLVVKTSIGIAVGDRLTGGDLLRDADVALYEAKGAGKNGYALFNPQMQSEASNRIELEFDLRSALDSDQFRLVYQPIYDLGDLTLIGVEALLRWQHPTRGLLQPNDFIPILEQSGQIREVGAWVLSQACQQMSDWHSRGDVLDISVNVSPKQLDDTDFVEDVRNAVTSSGLDATSLILEVSETTLMRNISGTAERLHQLRALGVRIAVDDFGTGYSSLAYLQRFPVDCLKIDRSFTNGITTSPESKALIGTLVQLGRDLGLTTLAEGVETVDEVDHLRSEHVNAAQGFLLSRPLDATALESQLLTPTRTKNSESPRG
jgi:diguanylate cyclase (GGDEF)-like protein